MFACLELDISSDDAELAADALFECGASGLEERGSRRKKRLIVYGANVEELEPLRAALPAALSARGIAPSAYRLAVRVDTTDWEHEYLRHLRAVEVAPGYWLRPTHDDAPLPEGAIVLAYEAARAFGDGSHATTRLAARAVVDHCRANPGARVLDFGSGNGVLALLAVRAGAGAALGVDIDPLSVDAARKNAELNQLSAQATFVLAGHEPELAFDWVVANLEEPALLETAAELAAQARRTNTAVGVPALVITGFLAERAGAVAAMFAERGLAQLRTSTEDEWALIELGLASA